MSFRSSTPHTPRFFQCICPCFFFIPSISHFLLSLGFPRLRVASPLIFLLSPSSRVPRFFSPSFLLPSFLFLIKGVWSLSFPFYSLHVLGAAVSPSPLRADGSFTFSLRSSGVPAHRAPAPTLWVSCASVSPTSPRTDATATLRPQDGARSFAPPPDVTALPPGVRQSPGAARGGASSIGLKGADTINLGAGRCGDIAGGLVGRCGRSRRSTLLAQESET